ncbi:MAG: glycoside hydrolase [Defluviitaleaceae bacterium]|nr:glycoside hydrolase [Defluviitaleaceae bacterium]
MAKIIGAKKITISCKADRYLCEGDIVRLGNGDLLTVFCDTRGLIHVDFDDIFLARSQDNGMTWHESDIVTVWKSDGYNGGNNPCISKLSDGTLLIYFLVNSFDGGQGIFYDHGPQSNLYSLRECEGCFFLRSNDDGRTWSAPYKANTAPMRWGQPADGLVEMPDGTLYLAMSGLHNGPWTRQNSDDLWRSFLMRSDDKGLHWEYYSTIAYDPAKIISFHEPGLARAANGTLVCMMRSEHAPRRRHGHLWISFSNNNGEWWTPPQPTNIWGYPADLLTLADGRMLAAYSHRRDPYGLRGCVSRDGLTWDAKDEFVIIDGGDDKKRTTGAWWHIGYPASCQLADGSIITVAHEWTQDAEPFVQYMFAARYSL